MHRIRSSEDPVECARVWQELWPQECLFDLWPVRSAFAAAYGRTPCFLMAENAAGRPCGLLALAATDKPGQYGFFPGETWLDKTWLEQNKIPAHSPEILASLLAAAPGQAHLRYITGDTLPNLPGPLAVDEVGYLFRPGAVGYSFDGYLSLFSGKSRKQLLREVASLEQHGLALRINHLPDLDLIFQINRNNFGAHSYFADPRFVDAFERLAAWLHKAGMLRLTTVLLGGRVAAVDIGGLWQGHYTLLGGCTVPEFPGVAKLINLHHLRQACAERMQSVDFLCGDFNWKKRFHLSERPLYELSVRAAAATGQVAGSSSDLKIMHV